MAATHRIKSSDDIDGDRATENERRPGEAVAGAPGQGDDCKHAYNGETHKFTERHRRETEPSPSAGWREVYYHMEADQP